jgi:hypothetical protein
VKTSASSEKMRILAASRASADCSRCGHRRAAHEHYRTGSDCSLCACRRFTRLPRNQPGVFETWQPVLALIALAVVTAVVIYLAVSTLA